MMKKVLKICILITLLAGYFTFLVSNSKVEAVTVTPVEAHGRLSVSGTKIVDANGKTFQLRGVSTHGIAWFPQYVNQDAFIYMRDNWNINAIRLAMYSDPNAGYNASIHEKVKEGVEYAKNAGLYVIIDWHILGDNNPNMYKISAINFFKEMATLYKDDVNVIYEICNEPNGDVQWQRDIKPYAEEVISEIRKIDNDAIIIVGTPTWSQDVDVVAQSPITGYSNIMYTLHFYAATHKQYLRDKLTTAINAGLPVFVTEFGICDASGNGAIDTEEADEWISTLNSNNISFMIWQLSNKQESASLIRSDVTKVTGWTYDELAQEGKWFVDTLKQYPKEESQNIDSKGVLKQSKILNNYINDKSVVVYSVEGNTSNAFKFSDIQGNLKIKSIDGTLVNDSSAIKTGSIIKDENNKEYIVVIHGDTASNGKINTGDVLAIQRIIVGRIAATILLNTSADLNGDGKVNTADVIILQRYIVGRVSEI